MSITEVLDYRLLDIASGDASHIPEHVEVKMVIRCGVS